MNNNNIDNNNDFNIDKINLSSINNSYDYINNLAINQLF